MLDKYGELTRIILRRFLLLFHFIFYIFEGVFNKQLFYSRFRSFRAYIIAYSALRSLGL